MLHLMQQGSDCAHATMFQEEATPAATVVHVIVCTNDVELGYMKGSDCAHIIVLQEDAAPAATEVHVWCVTDVELGYMKPTPDDFTLVRVKARQQT